MMLKQFTYLKLQSALQKNNIFLSVFILFFSKNFKTFLKINLVEMQNCVTNLKLNPFKHKKCITFCEIHAENSRYALKNKGSKRGVCSDDLEEPFLVP